MPPGMAIPVDAIKRMLQQGGDPSSLFNGSTPPPQTSAPGAPTPPTAPPVQTAQPTPAAAPPTPATPTAPPAGTLSQAVPTFQSPEEKSQYLGEHPVALPSRPVGDFDTGKHATLRRVLASLFAGTAEFGGDLNHHPGQGQYLFDRWHQQDQAQRQYDTGLPALKQEAENKAYNQYLEQGAKTGEIEKAGVETQNLQQNNPATQRKAQFLTQLQGDAESGKYDPAALKAKYLRIAQFNRIAVAPEEIETTITGTKPLGSKYTLTRDSSTQAPIELVDRQGNHFSESNLPKDPEALQMWNDAKTAAGNKVKTEEDKEKRVAGYAADRQAQAFSNQTKMEETKKVQPHIDTALGADERLGRMESAYKKAKGGDQQAMLSLLTDHIGMTLGMQKGARITKDILNEAAQSQPWLSKIASKFDDRGYLSGVTLGPEQMKQMLDLGYEARDRAFQGAHDAATSYGQSLPEGFVKVESKRTLGAKPAIEGQQAGKGPKGATHTGIGSVDKKKHWLDAQGNDLGLAE